MLSDTLNKGLAEYGIGAKIRSLRLGKKLGLVKLGEHTGLSPAMLSKIERGQVYPTLPTLLRIALVFGVGLEHFFSEPEERPTLAVVRRKDRIRLPDRPGAEPPAYVFESLDFTAADRQMEAYHADFSPGAPASAPHTHNGAEVLYIIRGQLRLDMGGEIVTLGEGDAAYFDSSVPHSYCGYGDKGASALVVVTSGEAAQEAP
ncbi:helix-turn-helix domain-containing protein [Pelagibacterium xiamenense]|uniref:helix-turn-helix domain-containing protein n=1 Tax=Pelagibacterium xiamenense TaxID=2901140 RepID=UPI001E4C1145|nr:cupin domain-containing protein [Pelagibacterium xiamenense]MCD7059925.1 cupin domain-containing protein [Pelagibacterium xiamenense]